MMGIFLKMRHNRRSRNRRSLINSQFIYGTTFGIIFRRAPHWTTLAIETGRIESGVAFVLQQDDMGNFNDLHKQVYGTRIFYNNMEEYTQDILGVLSGDTTAQELLAIIMTAKKEEDTLIWGMSVDTSNTFKIWYDILLRFPGREPHFLNYLRTNFKEFNVMENGEIRTRTDYFFNKYTEDLLVE